MIKIECNSKEIKKGQTFIAIKGEHDDGYNYIDEAINNGATKIICEKEIDVNVPYEIVNNTNQYLINELVNNYSEYFEDLKIIGITGTNGKTTSCYLIYQMLNELGSSVAYIGTLGYFYKDEYISLNNTTPDILTLYNLLYKAKESGAKIIVMEVSSQGLAFNRLSGINLSIAVFTNLTQDHLDYHKTMGNYLNYKLKIINQLDKNGLLIVNSDDKNSSEFIKLFNKYKTLGTTGEYKIINYDINSKRTLLRLSYDSHEYIVKIPLIGKFNIYNYLTMMAVVNSLGYKISDILKYTKYLKAPKGRCEKIEFDDKTIIIDYAHTPDAVEKVITTFNELKSKKLITIIGCGGDRDTSKRPIIGNISTSLSDYVIFTDDNPRYEDNKLIINDILNGVKSNNYKVIYDRSEAIKEGIKMLNKGDILLILGKGHETYQIILNKKNHFDDSEIVNNIIKSI